MERKVEPRVSELFTSVEDLAARIPDGAKVALAPDYSGCSMATVRALIARGAKDLHLVGVPSVGFQGDMLIGVGCVATLETAAVTLDEYGPAPRFMAAVKAGSIKVIDGTCPAIHAGLQAAEKGLSYREELRKRLQDEHARGADHWIYNDLDAAMKEARSEAKRKKLAKRYSTR